MHQRSTNSTLPRVLALGVLAGGALLLAGCSAPPWIGMPKSTAMPATTAPATPVQNDLAAGAATRTIEVGAITLTVDYWSTLSMDEWTAAANKPLSFAVHATVTPADGQKIYLSRVTATPVVANASGALPSFEPLVDQASVAPGYLVLDPYSFSQTFIVPPVDAEADRLELTMKYELLQQSTPTSNDFAKQTAVDSLTIAIAPAPER
ncbi:hypothetical protein [Agromyces badenianii]|uniref:hypothetical protein n=1 Tax=Agromyces badenianii TaxID=2080742 RepID=UPI000D5A20C5|nr:hypothetical protein [Agromyces badenianii]PWC04896.1 hypothetical protein DCE94_00710 [Agromyces badenianii]